MYFYAARFCITMQHRNQPEEVSKTPAEQRWQAWQERRTNIW
jgi:hypothetical protein